MRVGRIAASLPLGLCLVSLSGVVAAAVGTVVDDKYLPIEGARVCYFIDNVELLCTLTDAEGRYELPVSDTDTIRAHATGFNPKSFSIATQHGPVTLQRAPALKVRLVDAATGDRIEKGEVIISYPTGKELGPFPANQAGLRIKRGLTAGEVRVVGKAAGFLDSDPAAVTLKPGEEADVLVRLIAVDAKKPD